MTAEEKIVEVLLTEITPGPNDRKVFNQGKLQELADDIRKNGLRSPILLRPNPAQGQAAKYEIVYGERRWRAHGINGAVTIKAIIRDMDDKDASQAMLTENLHRVDLNPIEEGQAYADRMTRFGLSEEEIAAEQSRSPDLVKRRLRLMQLHPDIQALVANGNMSIGYADAMFGLDYNFQILRAIPYFNTDPSVYAFGAFCAKLLGEQNQAALWSENEMAAFMTKPIEIQADEWGISEEEYGSRAELLAENRRLLAENVRLQEENDSVFERLDHMTTLLEGITEQLERQVGKDLLN